MPIDAVNNDVFFISNAEGEHFRLSSDLQAEEHFSDHEADTLQGGDRELSNIHLGNHVNYFSHLFPVGGQSSIGNFLVDVPEGTFLDPQNLTNFLEFLFPDARESEASANEVNEIATVENQFVPFPGVSFFNAYEGEVPESGFHLDNNANTSEVNSPDISNILNELAPNSAAEIIVDPLTGFSSRNGSGSQDGEADSESELSNDVETAATLRAPTLTLFNASGAENENISLNITVTSNSTNIANEEITIIIAGLPAGGMLSAGIDNGDGTWTLTPDQLDGLTFAPPIGIENYELTVTAISSSNGNSESSEDNFTLDVTAGGDVIRGTNGADTLVGSEYSDEIYGLDGSDTVFGNNGDDSIYGDQGNDTLFGGDGRDEIHGGDNKDFLFGQAGDDSIYGDEGNDELFGDIGNDTLYGGEGEDRLFGQQGNDVLYGGERNDELYGASGDDFLHGGEGADRLHGESGSDQLYGEGGSDLLYGGVGNDELYGGEGEDELYGNEDNDRLDGGAGADLIYGGSGNDTISVGEGKDVAYGNEGNDTFLFGAGDGKNNIFHGGDSWTDTVELKDTTQGPSAIAETPGSWVLNTSSGYTIDEVNRTIHFNNKDASGTITLSDGSELHFDQVEDIKW